MNLSFIMKKYIYYENWSQLFHSNSNNTNNTNKQLGFYVQCLSSVLSKYIVYAKLMIWWHHRVLIIVNHEAGWKIPLIYQKPI